jgi:hypothetical protein
LDPSEVIELFLLDSNGLATSELVSLSFECVEVERCELTWLSPELAERGG